LIPPKATFLNTKLTNFGSPKRSFRKPKLTDFDFPKATFFLTKLTDFSEFYHIFKDFPENVSLTKLTDFDFPKATFFKTKLTNCGSPKPTSSKTKLTDFGIHIITTTKRRCHIATITPNATSGKITKITQTQKTIKQILIAKDIFTKAFHYISKINVLHHVQDTRRTQCSSL